MSNLFDLQTYQSYAHNRLESPEVSPERWARIFPNAAAMEKRFVREFEAALMQSTTGILDVADHTISTAENQPFKDGTTVGSSGEATATASPLQSLPVHLMGREVSGTVEGHGTGTTQLAQTASKGSSENQASPADQILPSLTASADKGVQSTASDCAPENTSYFPLAETVEKIIANPRLTQKQRIDGEMRLIWKGRA